eukprot:Sdes_comp20971_c0_seq3m19045
MWADKLMEKADPEKLEELFKEVGLVFVRACSGIDAISVCREADNASGLIFKVPVLPHEIAAVPKLEFKNILQSQVYRMDDWSEEFNNRVLREFHAFRNVVRNEKEIS